MFTDPNEKLYTYFAAEEEEAVAEVEAEEGDDEASEDESAEGEAE